MDKACIFDLNGTILNLGGLDDNFVNIFGANKIRYEWFNSVLQTCMAQAITGRYTKFSAICEKKLINLAEAEHIRITWRQKHDFRKAMLSLPAYPDVEPALVALKTSGYRIVALTNSSRSIALAQLRNAGIDGLFDDVISTDTSLAFKPAQAPYDNVVKRLGIDPGLIWMVAGHMWDLAGADQAGLKTAFILRKLRDRDDSMPAPDLTGDNLIALAASIKKADKGWFGKLFGKAA